MKIKVIGSGSMWNSYNSASYMIDDDILVDVPNGMCKYLFRLGLNPMTISNVLITHLHGDHFFDMPFYLLLKSKAKNPKVNIFCPSKGKRKIKKLLKLAFPNSVSNIYDNVFLKYNYDESFQVNRYNITRYLVDHGKLKPAYGYVFESNNKKVGFTGDTTLCDNVEKMASICDYLFCDCMFIKGNNKHMGIDQLQELSKRFARCKFVVSHLENITREEIKKMKIKNVIVPNDGDDFEI